MLPTVVEGILKHDDTMWEVEKIHSLVRAPDASVVRALTSHNRDACDTSKATADLHQTHKLKGPFRRPDGGPVGTGLLCLEERKALPSAPFRALRKH